MDTMTNSNLSKAGVAFLLVSLGAACGADASSPGASSSGTPGSSGSSGSPGTGGTPGNVAIPGKGPNPETGGKPLAAGAVSLGGAGSYVMLAKTGISTVPTSAITGNLGLSPAAASYITGFALAADASNVFSMSPQVTGRVYAADYTAPAPDNLTTAVGAMETAFTDAAGRAPTVTELGAGNIGGMTLKAGVYKWGTGLLIPTNVTLDGNGTAVWIFQIAQNLTVSSGTKVVLTGGAVAKNIFWQVSGAATLDTTAHLEGVVLSQTGIAVHTGASVNGRLLAQTAVTIDGSTIVEPAQ